MPALFIFLLKVNAALLLFCAGYYLVLRHLTFYTLNRIYLVTAILFASIYPKINLSDFAERHQQIAKPVQAVVLNWQPTAEIIAKPLAIPVYWHWIELIFWTGAALLAVRLLVQLYSLFKLYRKSTAAQINNHSVRIIDGNAGPFSFWKSIYINPANHSTEDLKAILLHEQVHVNEWHTLDILLAEMSTIFYWFNPGVWLMKKAVRENIEFITDNKILKAGADSKQYQYSLVNVSFAAQPNTIVNHFNISTIKKRIIMMNAKRSSKINLTRYAFLVPAVVTLLLVFSISKAAYVKKHYKIFDTLAVNKIATINKTIKVNQGKIIKKLKLEIDSAMTQQLHSIKPLKARVVDTLKNGNIIIGTTTNSDSLNYVINGVKSSKVDFKKLDPKNIFSLDIVSSEQVNKIIDGLDNKHEALFITTDDSESGKQFKNKIDKLSNNSYTIKKVDFLTGTNNMAVVSNKYKVADTTIAVIGYKKATSMARSNTVNEEINAKLSDTKSLTSVGLTNKQNIAKALTIKSVSPKTAQAKTIIINGDFKGFTVAGNGDIIVTSLKGPDSATVNRGTYAYLAKTVNGVAADQVDITENNIVKARIYKLDGTRSLSSTPFNNETNINHLQSKLILINGKEASAKDLKKLSASDIESMSAKSGDDIIKQYGNKATNGVLFITTKK